MSLWRNLAQDIQHDLRIDAYAHVQRLSATHLDSESTGRVATVPAGYADGVPRNLGMVGGEVLIRGRRVPIIGNVTMDQLLVDLGDVPAEPDDEVVLIGRQGDDEITATEWGARLGTISYEVITGIGARVPRTYVGEDD